MTCPDLPKQPGKLVTIWVPMHQPIQLVQSILRTLENRCAEVLRLPIVHLDAEAIVGRAVGLFELLGVATADTAPSLDGAVLVQALIHQEHGESAVGQAVE